MIIDHPVPLPLLHLVRCGDCVESDPRGLMPSAAVHLPEVARKLIGTTQSVLSFTFVGTIGEALYLSTVKTSPVPIGRAHPGGCLLRGHRRHPHRQMEGDGGEEEARLCTPM